MFVLNVIIISCSDFTFKSPQVDQILGSLVQSACVGLSRLTSQPPTDLHNPPSLDHLLLVCSDYAGFASSAELVQRC